MKYWRGYLTAGIFGLIALAFMKLGIQHWTLVDMVYPYVTRTAQDMLVSWSSGVDFCLWQVLLVVIGVLILASIVLMVVLKWNPVQWFGWVLAVFSGIFMLNTLIYGLNNYAGPIATDVRMETAEYSATVEELNEAMVYYRDKANEYAAQVDRDGSGNASFADFETLAEQAADGFEHLVYEKSFSVFAGSNKPVKKLAWSGYYSSRGVTDVFCAITGEAGVNPDIPDVCLPFAMCHVMAQRKCIAAGGDVNFAAFLACRFNESVQFKYSAYLMGYRYCYEAMASFDSPITDALAAEAAQGESDALKADLEAVAEFFKGKDSDLLSAVSENFYIDAIGKLAGDDENVPTYDTVSDLLVNWYIQEIVLPTQMEEEEKFDPLDPEQVDLSGLVNAQ